MPSQIIKYSFYLLFFLTPLIWTSNTFELFEYNKMMLTYALTIIITGIWLLKMLFQRRVIFKSTPLDLPIILFLTANIISTILSIDPHISLWGYYSRSNGGLLSTISYILLFYALVSNLNKEEVLTVLKVGLVSSLVVSLWAIPEHFGKSPSCGILNFKSMLSQGTSFVQALATLISNPEASVINATCWVQDVQARVFATFGQPNWLAAYLEMLIFPSFYFFLAAKKLSSKLLYLIMVVCLYAAFTFTYSRGGTIGLIGGVVIFGLFQFINLTKVKPNFRLKFALPENFRLQAILVLILLIVNLIFGSALVRFEALINSQTQNSSATGVSQIESGGTESGTIRLIVWRGALEIFKHYPLFGSGVETFALSYYNFRPQAHNLVSEWDFLYNKAHNEYLNYLATTGAVGFLTYMSVILAFTVWSIKKILYSENQNSKLFNLAILAGFYSNLIQNFFSFSVVMTALLFFLLPAINFVVEDTVHQVSLSKRFKFLSFLPNLIFSHNLFTYLMVFVVSVLTLISLYMVDRFYRADLAFAQGYKADQQGIAGRAYNLLSYASVLNPYEPFYQSELGYAAAAASSVLKDDDATQAAVLKQEAIDDTQYVLYNHPKNVSFFRTAVRTYYFISTYDPSFIKQTLDLLDKTIALAPTDPKLTYNKAVILSSQDDIKGGISALKQTIALKPDYSDAYYALGLLYFKDNQKQKALEQMKKVLTLIPNQPEATQKLQEWATSSASKK